MSEPLVIWRRGDRWADLRPLLLRPVTAVTTNGTAHLINVTEGWSCRLPLAGGHWMVGDLERLPLSSISVATSCGITSHGVEAGSWHATTKVAYLIDGLRPDWATYVEWPPAEPWNPAGHPDRSCGAAHCIVKKYLDQAS